MKISYLLGISLIALAAGFSPASHAAISSAEGDLILAFRTQDSSKNGYNLEVDLGSYTQFSTLSPGTVLNLNPGGFYGANGGLSASDLITVYGLDWNASSNTLAWSVAGTVFPNLLATFSAGYTPSRKGSGQQQEAAGKLQTIRTGIDGRSNTYVNGSTTVTLASSNATAVNASEGASYYTQIRGNSPTLDYKYFQISTEALVPSSGTSNLTLWQLNTGSGPGTALGIFSLGSNGGLTFTAAPEPTSALLLGLSGMALLLRRRRPSAASRA